MAQRRPNPLSSVGVDRLGELRKHGELLRAHLQGADVRVRPLCGGQVCVAGSVAASLGADTIDPEEAWLLGEADGLTYLAVDVASETWKTVPLPPEARLTPLREVAALLTPLDGNLLAMAAGLATWHGTSRFCGSCGSLPDPNGPVRPPPRLLGLRTRTSPRTDPAVIVLVTEEDAILLGRNPAWPPGFASVLAGFVEPFESLTRELDPDPEELADACWYTQDEVAHGAVGLPPPLSISRRLIDDWLAADSTA